jgi:hypothetical protein
MTTVPPRWRKASRSAQDANCVELACDGLVRDSKNPAGGVLSVSLHTLLVSAKAGQLDR